MCFSITCRWLNGTLSSHTTCVANGVLAETDTPPSIAFLVRIFHRQPIRRSSFLVRCGLILDLLYHWPKFFQCGGVLGAELLWRATRIGVLHGVEHCAR
jgi:hypothetical protein